MSTYKKFRCFVFSIGMLSLISGMIFLFPNNSAADVFEACVYTDQVVELREHNGFLVCQLNSCEIRCNHEYPNCDHRHNDGFPWAAFPVCPEGYSAYEERLPIPGGCPVQESGEQIIRSESWINGCRQDITGELIDALECEYSYSSESRCSGVVESECDECAPGDLGCTSIGCYDRSDGDPCLENICENGSCGSREDPDCCETDDECDDSDRCTVGSCVDNECIHTPTLADCDDDNSCTTDFCNNDRCFNFPKKDCCSECVPGELGCLEMGCFDRTDNDPCLFVYCSLNTCFVGNVDCPNHQTCETGIGCPCSDDRECNDSDICTVDICNDEGVCENTNIEGCCVTKNDCDGAGGDKCLVDSCVDYVCETGPLCKEGVPCQDGICLCSKDADCEDYNGCTDDWCDSDDGECVFSFKEGCCESLDDCNDENRCTIDSCVNGYCEYEEEPDCCHTVRDCSDGNICTTHACDNGTCIDTPVEGCCVTDDDCEIENSCTTSFCEDFVCTSEPKECAEEEVCIDGKCSCDEKEDCDDEIICTDDKCVEGLCEHSSNDTGEIVLTLDQCPLINNDEAEYVAMFGNETSLNILASATIGKDVPEDCEVTITADFSELYAYTNTPPQPITCTSTNTCTLDITVTKDHIRDEASGKITVYVIANNCCLESPSDFKTIEIKPNPERVLHYFHGFPAAWIDFISDQKPFDGWYGSMDDGIDRIEEYGLSVRAYQEIAKFAKKNVLIEDYKGEDPKCKIYRTVNIAGWSWGGHTALYMVKRLAEEQGDEPIQVDNLFLVDPVPRGMCTDLWSDPYCYFAGRQCVGQMYSNYQQVIPFGARGRKVNMDTSERICGEFSTIRSPMGIRVKIGAHSEILENKYTEITFKGMFSKDMPVVRDDYICENPEPIDTELTPNSKGLKNCSMEFGINGPCYNPGKVHPRPCKDVSCRPGKACDETDGNCIPCLTDRVLGWNDPSLGPCITLQPGLNLIGLPVDPVDPVTQEMRSLDQLLILPDTALGATLNRLDTQTQEYLADVSYFGPGVGWFPKGVTLEAGEGFFVNLPGNGSLPLTFTGQSVGWPSRVGLNPGEFRMMVSPGTESLPLGPDPLGVAETLEFPAVSGDTVYLFDATTQTYSGGYVYFGVGAGWLGPNQNPLGPVLDPGQGFWLQAGPEE